MPLFKRPKRKTRRKERPSENLKNTYYVERIFLQKESVYINPLSGMILG